MPRRGLKIRSARVEEHQAICKIAKESPYTKDFSNMIFSSPACYQQGRIRVAEQGGVLVGFSCVRERKRVRPALVLYFVGVTSAVRGSGVGTILLEDLWTLSQQPRIELKVMKANPAVRLYRRLGYRPIGEAYQGQAWVLEAQRETPGG